MEQVGWEDPEFCHWSVQAQADGTLLGGIKQTSHRWKK